MHESFRTFSNATFRRVADTQVDQLLDWQRHQRVASDRHRRRLAAPGRFAGLRLPPGWQAQGSRCASTIARFFGVKSTGPERTSHFKTARIGLGRSGTVRD